MVSSGVPDEVPFDLTAKNALRQANRLAFGFANRIMSQVGVQSLDSVGDSPVIIQEAEVARRQSVVDRVTARKGPRLFPGLNNGQ